MGCVGGIGAMYSSGNDDANRRRLLLHCANLHRRCMRAQQETLAQGLALLPFDHQRVLRIARRMVGRKVE